jgi:hypothetical protein
MNSQYIIWIALRRQAAYERADARDLRTIDGYS